MKARVLRTNQIIEVEYLGKLGKFSKIFRDIQSGIEYTEKDIVFCFDFNSSVCTDRHQSERLLALGLKSETADAIIPIKFNPEKFPTLVPQDFWISDDPFYRNVRENSIPAWSLGRLIELCDEDRLPISFHKKGKVKIKVNHIHPTHDGRSGYNYYDSFIDCIEWLIKEGYFNKKYLV